jgi:hypothetical protein
MPRQANGSWAKYRNARKRRAELEAAHAKLQRSRPRTRGKKAAKMRALNKLTRQIRAAKGVLTKAQKAIAKAASARTFGDKIAREKRSEAAKRGWAKRRAGKASATAVQPIAAPSPKKTLPFLTLRGIIDVWPPSSDDRSKIGKYFGQIDRLLAHLPASFAPFEGDSIYDELSGEHLPFITDIDFILARSDEFNFGLSIYRDRHEPSKVA